VRERAVPKRPLRLTDGALSRDVEIRRLPVSGTVDSEFCVVNGVNEPARSVGLARARKEEAVCKRRSLKDRYFRFLKQFWPAPGMA
jgi:hypothetical protein